MTGTIGRQLGTLPRTSDGTTTSAPRGGTSSTATRAPAPRRQDDRMIVLPAFFVADLVQQFGGIVGETAGTLLGDAKLGRQVGDTAAALGKFLPFTVVPPSVAPQSAGPAGTPGSGADETMIVVPSAFLGGLLGGIGGNLLGGTIGEWFGDKKTGQTVGSTVGGVLGGLIPFQVVPPSLAPQSAGPDGATQQDPMVVVPASFFSNLVRGAATIISGSTNDRTVKAIAQGAAGLSHLIPFQDVPPQLVPQSAGPDGGGAAERMIVVPAGFLGNMLSGLADTVGGAVGGLFGHEQTGRDVGTLAKPLLELIPFHTVPPALMPQSAGPAGAADDQEELLVVPAGIFGGLLSTFAGAVGGLVGGLAGDARTGQAIGNAAAPLLDLIPFTVVAPRAASAGS